MGLRLYQITDTVRKAHVKDTYFDNKKLAKVKRGELNASEEPSNRQFFRYVVSPGPDHRNYNKPKT